MKRATITASILAFGLGWSSLAAHGTDENCAKGTAPGSANLCNPNASAQTADYAPPARSAFLERALRTRVGTHRAALRADNRDDLCQQGNASHETLAQHLAARLDQDGADNVTRGNSVERKVRLKLPCA